MNATLDARFAAAHRALLEDGSVQLDLPAIVPDPPPPAWLKAFGAWLDRLFAPVGRLIRWIAAHMPDAPFARFLLWAVLALAAAALVWLLWQQVRGRRWRWRRKTEVQGETAWVPEAAPVRAWLAEADGLAAEGRYAEAVHRLLIRSVDDIAARRPALVQPAITSRELSRAAAIPIAARELFAALAAVVERSLFGGGAVDVGVWQRCRADYAAFVQRAAWRA